MKISSPKFSEAWEKAVESMRGPLVENWHNVGGAFTNLIKSSDDCIVRRIAAHLGLRCYPHDYYGIDATFYEQSDLVPGTPAGSTWLSGMSVAFEHENNVNSGLYKEVSHLLLVDADLRVLVTYPGRDGINYSALTRAHALITGSRHAAHISEAENFLVILGYIEFRWEAFVYKTNGWRPLLGASA